MPTTKPTGAQTFSQIRETVVCYEVIFWRSSLCQLGFSRFNVKELKLVL